MGWASAGLANKIKTIINNTSQEISAKADGSKKILKKILTSEYYQDRIKNLSDKDVVTLLSKVKNGLNLATPVFDGARDTDIIKILETAGLDSSGQVALIDGRTGEALIER